MNHVSAFTPKLEDQQPVSSVEEERWAVTLWYYSMFRQLWLPPFKLVSTEHMRNTAKHVSWPQRCLYILDLLLALPNYFYYILLTFEVYFGADKLMENNIIQQSYLMEMSDEVSHLCRFSIAWDLLMSAQLDSTHFWYKGTVLTHLFTHIPCQTPDSQLEA